MHGIVSILQLMQAPIPQTAFQTTTFQTAFQTPASHSMQDRQWMPLTPVSPYH